MNRLRAIYSRFRTLNTEALAWRILAITLAVCLEIQRVRQQLRAKIRKLEKTTSGRHLSHPDQAEPTANKTNRALEVKL
jgi:hypothetical protein